MADTTKPFIRADRAQRLCLSQRVGWRLPDGWPDYVAVIADARRKEVCAPSSQKEILQQANHLVPGWHFSRLLQRHSAQQFGGRVSLDADGFDHFRFSQSTSLLQARQYDGVHVRRSAGLGGDVGDPDVGWILPIVVDPAAVIAG